MSKSIAKAKKEKASLINFKVSKEERKAIAARAKKFARGNLSLWLRYAAINHSPRARDLRKTA